MGVSKNNGTQIIHFNRVFPYKPSILGYHYFWKHPHIAGCLYNPRFPCLLMGQSEILAALGLTKGRNFLRIGRSLTSYENTTGFVFQLGGYLSPLGGYLSQLGVLMSFVHFEFWSGFPKIWRSQHPLTKKQSSKKEHTTGWWQLKDFLNFHPDFWGNDPIWRAYFSDGSKPPTRPLDLQYGARFISIAFKES